MVSREKAGEVSLAFRTDSEPEQLLFDRHILFIHSLTNWFNAQAAIYEL